MYNIGAISQAGHQLSGYRMHWGCGASSIQGALGVLLGALHREGAEGAQLGRNSSSISSVLYEIAFMLYNPRRLL